MHRARMCRNWGVAAMTGGLMTLGGALPAPAWAATAERIGDTVYYRADPGEQNRLQVNGEDAVVTFHDAGAAIRPGAGCSALADGGVVCGAGLPDVDNPARIDIRLGDGDDQATSESEALNPLEVDMRGGAGNDTLHSGSGVGETHVLRGGRGDDRLSAATNNIGDATFIGGRGNDTLENQEGGSASFYAGPGNDTMVMYDHGAALVMDGGTGADLYVARFFDDPAFVVSAIVPGPGRDTFSAPDGGPLALDLAACGGCVENVIGSPGDDTIMGDSQRNVLIGGDGNDALDPRGGSDDVAGGAGDDQIELRDGQRDTASCGDGVDQVSADALPADVVATDCEEVARSAPASGN
jgi:Ca2+-binding RTX toxin-like protein